MNVNLPKLLMSYLHNDRLQMLLGPAVLLDVVVMGCKPVSEAGQLSLLQAPVPTHILLPQRLGQAQQPGPSRRERLAD